ncbi:MAG: hypothetical protein Q9160_008494 [Pyrenula sp. 1 TL-2023]
MDPKPLRSMFDSTMTLRNQVVSVLKLLEVNRKTHIDTRGLIAPFGQSLWEDKTRPPNIEETNALYRKHALQLSSRACQKAIKEWGGHTKDITHTVAVTCTDAGSPGFDQAVIASLGLRLDVDSTLLHGVGCAGGLAALRTAAQLAKACGSRPAKVLVFACEIPSIHVSVELEDAELNPQPPMGPVLFSDGASGLIVSNGKALSLSRSKSIYNLVNWITTRVPETSHLMAYPLTPLGFKLSLSREVPVEAASALSPTFTRLMKTIVQESVKQPEPQDFDWALHPGGLSVIKHAQTVMNLTDDHLRASYDLYKHHGNTSSVAVIAVLDRLRHMGNGRNDVVACSFGPGLTVEITVLQRVRT